MLSDKVLKALNDQIQMEFSSAYLYLAMGAYFESENLPGFAKWMYAQFGEEQGHARRLFTYVTDRGGRVVLQGIEKPTESYSGPKDVFEKVLAHEKKVTTSINGIYDLAVEAKDYPTQSQLNWFVDEQVEEEKAASEILDQLKLIEGHPHLLLMMDRQLGQRKFGEDD
jgi:ferritin